MDPTTYPSLRRGTSGPITTFVGGPSLSEGPALTDADETLDPATVSEYRASDNLLTANRQKTIDETNMVSQASIVILNGQQTFTMAIVNGGPAGGTVYTFPADSIRRGASFMLDLSGNIVLGSVWFIDSEP